jgi:electron transport complex protein RnfC
MMGAAVGDLNVPTTKGISGILVLSRNGTAAPSSRVYPCIKCGQCVDVCPMRLNPSRLGLLARKGRYAVMDEEFNLKACFECGCCSYVCPSRIPLVQLFRVAKATNREMEVRT